MPRTITTIVLICALAIMPVSMNAAQRTIKRNTLETRIALVIGNSAYKNSPLINPVNDAGINS